MYYYYSLYLALDLCLVFVGNEYSTTWSFITPINCKPVWNAETDSSCVKDKKEKDKKNRKKDKENGSGSEAGNHNDIDAPDVVVRDACE